MVNARGLPVQFCLYNHTERLEVKSSRRVLCGLLGLLRSPLVYSHCLLN